MGKIFDVLFFVLLVFNYFLYLHSLSFSPEVSDREDKLKVSKKEVRVRRSGEQGKERKEESQK